MSSKTSVEIARDIGARITLIRGHRVLLDADLAALYGVTTKLLNEQARRNTGRFPVDFAFQLSAEEADRARPAPEIPAVGFHGIRRHHGCHDPE